MGCPVGRVREHIWLALVGSKLETGQKIGKHQLLIKSCGLGLMANCRGCCLAAWTVARDSRLTSCKSDYNRLATGDGGLVSWAGGQRL